MKRKQMSKVSAFLSNLLLVMALLSLFVIQAAAQTTAFTYQGILNDGGNPANANYDMQFKLFDTVDVGTGTQQGSTITNAMVAVTNGIFSVALDFGAGVFDGTARYLEIGVRLAGSPDPYAVLSPRHAINATPYAVKSLNATTSDGLSAACVNCVTSSQIGSVDGSVVTGTIPVESVPAGSANYIQNSNSPQASSAFNISGTGTAGTFNATTQYNIGGSRILSAPGTNNLFVGLSAGQSNTSGGSNAFAGANAGLTNSVGARNAFFGFNAGRNNTGDAFGNGSDNAFFGSSAGVSNTGQQNSFFGSGAGAGHTTGNFNALFGEASGLNSTTGGLNTFIGSNTGFSNIGPGNTSGSNNTALGMGAKIGLDPGNNNLMNATAIGANAFARRSNTLVLGSINGINGATADTFVGVGTASPSARFHVVQSGDYQLRLDNPSAGGGFWNIGQSDNSFHSGGGKLFFVPDSIESMNATVVFTTAGNVGIGSQTPTAAKLVVQDTSVGTAVAGTSTTGSGVFGESTSSTGWGVYGRNNAGGYAVYADGNAAQPPNTNGFAKAMLLVNADGSINICYNSQLTGAAATAVPCGFTVNRTANGTYNITFPFQVSNRFLSATVASTDGLGFSVQAKAAGSQLVNLVTFNQFSGLTNWPFYLIVY